MITKAIDFLSKYGLSYVYLGTAYTTKARYKLQFHGLEFFNGWTWSPDLNELKFLLKRDGEEVYQHLLESQDYVDLFLAGSLETLNR